MWRASTSLLLFALAAAPSAQEPLIGGLDHVPVAVSDLERAADAYRRLGFVLKPGAPHANGIRNVHAKFTDGTEIELITAPAGVDDLTRKYRAHLADGDGPAFLALHALDPQAVRQVVPADHRTRTYVFFGQLNRSPTDRPEHFEHPNTAEALVKVWLASDDFSAEQDLFKRLGTPIHRERSRTLIDVPAYFARPGGDEIEMLPGFARRVKGRPIIAAAVRVRDFAKLTSVLRAGGIPARALTRDGRRRLSVEPEYACGWRLEFVER
jgi:catechol 2,3-dioxygenase-like lactoylglutathione lyase family enzyme